MIDESPARLEEVAPLVRKHLLPLIQASAETCVRTYVFDEFNDTYTFGAQLWRLTWNRCLALTGEEGSPFSYSGDKNDYGIRHRGIKIEPHPVRMDSRLPNNANAMKKRLEFVQLSLFLILPVFEFSLNCLIYKELCHVTTKMFGRGMSIYPLLAPSKAQRHPS